MAFDLGAVVAHVKADVSNFQDGMGKARKELGSMQEGSIDLVGGLKNVATVAAVAGTAVATGLGFFLKSAADEAREFNRQMTTLDIIAGRFGVSGQEAKKAAQELGAALGIGVGPAAESLQNLLKSGLNLEQSSELIKRFTNEAITGKSPTISLAQAVQNLSFAYATGNSALGNLSGVSENFSDITEKGRVALEKEGVATSAITEEMAKFRGMMDLTSLTLGSAEKIMDDGTKKTIELEQAFTNFKIAIGQAVLPLLTGLTVVLVNFVLPAIAQLQPIFQKLITDVGGQMPGFGKQITDVLNGVVFFFMETLWPAIQTLTKVWNENSFIVMGIVKLTFDTISGIIQIVMSMVVGIVGMALEIMSGDWNGAANYALKMLQGMYDGGVKILNGILSFITGWGGNILSKLVKPFEDAWNKISDFMNKIKDALDFTKRHSPSVVDIVTMGVKKVNTALDGLRVDIPVGNAALPAPAITRGSGMNAYSINIDMNGAMISDELGAERIAQKIGDTIINRLKSNVRF